MTLKNQHVKLPKTFFWKSLVFGRKNPSNFCEDLFFFLKITLNFGRKNISNFGEDITSYFGQNCGIFSVRFELHKTGNPSYLIWPRAHVRHLAALHYGIRGVAHKLISSCLSGRQQYLAHPDMQSK